MTQSKIFKTFVGIACTLLIGMAVLHGSGITYITGLIQKSNTEAFLKEIFPVLFAHPSIHLFGLAALGILTFFMKYEAKKVLFFIVVMVILDSLVAFYLGAIIPGVLLLIAALFFVLGAVKSVTQE